jgi:hypothetical protein
MSRSRMLASLAFGMLAGVTVNTMAVEFTSRTTDLEPAAPVSVYRPRVDPCTFTQNTQFDLMNGSLVCSGGGVTTDNQFLRVFDLDIEHGFGGNICLDSVDYAVERSSGNPTVTFNVYCTPQGLADTAPNNGIDRDVELDPGLVFSTTAVQPDAEFEYFNQPLGGCCDADLHDMAIEIATEDCGESGTCVSFIPGVADFASATKPYYISAADCGIVDPINAGNINGLGAMQLVMTLNATCEDTGEVVPASGVVSGTVLLLLMLAAGIRLVR